MSVLNKLRNLQHFSALYSSLQASAVRLRFPGDFEILQHFLAWCITFKYLQYTWSYSDCQILQHLLG